MTFPPIVKGRWGITGQLTGGGALGCKLCHTSDSGGPGTATRPFGRTMHETLHVMGGDTASLTRALDHDRSYPLDSDGDSISDYQELAVDHTDPNDRTKFELPPPPVDAGLGGQGGETSTGNGDDGGHSNVVEPPPYTPPPANLPPPFEHGCSTSRQTSEGALGGAALVIFGALVRRRRRHH